MLRICRCQIPIEHIVREASSLTIVTVVIYATMAVVGALECAIDVQMKIELRGIFMLAYPGQVCVQVFVDIRFIRRWRLDLVVDRSVES